MKKKLLLLTLALWGMSALVGAQTDVTKYFLSNYSFDENFDYTAGQTTAVKQEIKTIDGWKQVFTHDFTIAGVYEFGFAGTFNTATVPAVGYDGEAGGGLALSTGWDAEFPYTQELTLPAGTYTINVPTYNGCDKTAATSMLAWIPSSGTTVSSTTASYKANDWTLDQITFTLTKTTTGKLRIGMKAAGGGSANSAKLVIDYVQIMGSDMSVDKSTLAADITKATKAYGDGSGVDAASLKTAIGAAQAVYDDETATLETVLDAQYALEKAIEAYLQQNASEDNPIDYTKYILNPSFETGNFTSWTNTNFQAQSNTAFTKKSGKYYVEKWVGKGNAVGNATIRQTLKNLPNGKYKMVVSAQNYDEKTPANVCTGAYIFAGDQKVEVTQPADYTLNFTNIAGQVQIGYAAEDATGNWIAADNFRLYLVGHVDSQAILGELARLIEKGDSLLTTHVMSAEASGTLAPAVAKAKKITDASKVEDIQKATLDLTEAIKQAEASIARFQVLANRIEAAQALVDSYMSSSASEELLQAIATGKGTNGTNTNTEIEKAISTLEAVTQTAKADIDAYASLAKELTAANALYDASKQGASELKAAIEEAQALYDTHEAAATETDLATKQLKRAELAFNLANSTKGTGAAPKVTKTYSYVATGATEALMRAMFYGANLIERGVCWSTEHTPTVLDERTTDYYNVNGALFHITQLKPATVYYLRPYAINNTYEVAYGDEVKIVTHPYGNCTWSWNNGAPTEAANTRCRNAIKQTIDYFNEWTGIKGFKLSGRYGSGTPTADCGYGGSMRIGPNAGNQAIGTVIHETGHGVGVGTHYRWYSCSDTRANTTHGKWLGREATRMIQFLENKEGNSECYMTGDGTHGWAHSGTYDWFVNGADKDKHTAIQYIGGCCLLYALFIDGLCPTTAYPNGLPGYTYNYDAEKKYYIMSKSKSHGLGDGLIYQRTATNLAWKPMLSASGEIGDSAAWRLDYIPETGYYTFRNASTGKYLTHATTNSTITLKEASSASSAECFQLMPDRTDVTIGSGLDALTTHGYWFTWNANGNKSMEASALISNNGYGTVLQNTFNFSDNATAQQWIIISEDELEAYQKAAVSTGISLVGADNSHADGTATVTAIYSVDGRRLTKTQPGLNIIRYSDGTTRKVMVK